MLCWCMTWHFVLAHNITESDKDRDYFFFSLSISRTLFIFTHCIDRIEYAAFLSASTAIFASGFFVFNVFPGICSSPKRLIQFIGHVHQSRRGRFRRHYYRVKVVGLVWTWMKAMIEKARLRSSTSKQQRTLKARWRICWVLAVVVVVGDGFYSSHLLWSVSKHCVELCHGRLGFLERTVFGNENGMELK